MLGPSAHIDTFTRDSLPDRNDWPVITGGPSYPEWLNAGVELTDAMVALGHGERIALCGKALSVSYAELADWTTRIAQCLAEDLGVVPGNRVLIHGGNTPAMVACWIGAMKAGAVAVNAMPMLRAAELGTIVDKARVTVALCDERVAAEMKACAETHPGVRHVVTFSGDARAGAELGQRLQAKDGAFAPVNTGRDDVALLAFTSGSTGTPKATMHFHRDILTIADGYARDVIGVTPDDICIGTPPIAFTFGLGAMAVFPLRFGACGVLRDDLTPGSLGAAIARHKATICFTAPTAYRAMIAEGADPADLASLRLAFSGGETLPATIYEQWMQKTSVPILDGIGATELLHVFITNRPGTAQPGSTGIPVSGYEARIVDAQMRELPRNTPGRLAIRGPTGCRYLADDRQRDYVQDGWNLTGDTFTQDESGLFHYVARSDDMIQSAGYNISGPEVEAALLGHPAVLECAVVAAPDEARGHIVSAHVIVGEGRTADPALARELQDHVKATIAPYKYPRAVHFVAELPKTQTGKIQRFRLRESDRP